MANVPIFSVVLVKNGNLRQLNASVPPSPYPMLFRVTRELYTLVFRPKQLWKGGGEGSYFFCLEEMVVWRKSYRILRRNCLDSFVRVCPSEHSNFAQSTKNKLVHTMAIAAIKMKFGALNLIKIYSITVLSPNTFVSSNSNGKHSIHSRNIQIDR